MTSFDTGTPLHRDYPVCSGKARVDETINICLKCPVLHLCYLLQCFYLPHLGACMLFPFICMENNGICIISKSSAGI